MHSFALILNFRETFSEWKRAQALTLVGPTMDNPVLYCKDTEPLYHSYSLVSLLSGIYPLPAWWIESRLRHGTT